MNKKELMEQYKNRVQIGGVFAIKNTVLDKWYVEAISDLTAAENKFKFFGATQKYIERDYKAQHGKGFEFVVLEELKKSENQTGEEFDADLELLKEIWIEKLVGQDLY